LQALERGTRRIRDLERTMETGGMSATRFSRQWGEKGSLGTVNMLTGICHAGRGPTGIRKNDT
jgi:hypothetical protein